MSTTAASIGERPKPMLVTLPTEMLSAVAQHLDSKAYLSFRLTCRTTSKINFETFAKQEFRAVSVHFRSPEKWNKLIELLNGSSELAQHVSKLYMTLPQTHRSKLLASRPSVPLPTRELLRSLPCLTELVIRGMDTANLKTQLQISTLLQDLATTGTPLKKLELQYCNVSSAEIRNILEGIPTLTNICLHVVTCTDGWVNGLCTIATAQSSSLKAVRLLQICKAEMLKSGDTFRDAVHFLGDAFYEEASAWGDYGRGVVKNMRTPAGIQQYKLTSLEALLFGRYAMRARIKVILGHMISKEELEALELDD